MKNVVPLLAPVFILIGLGFLLRELRFFSDSALSGLKKFLTTIGLPASLFLTMLRSDVSLSYLSVTLAIFLMLASLFFLGRLVMRLTMRGKKVFPFYMTGYCFGLLGLPLFSMVWGEENSSEIAILGIGHEIFIWLVYRAALRWEYGGTGAKASDALSVLRSPTLIGIFLGLGANALFGSDSSSYGTMMKTVVNATRYLSLPTTPLMLIAIGYGLSFEKKYMRDALSLIALRLALTLPVTYLFKFLLFDRIVSTPLFGDAFFTLVIMPPAFSLPILLSDMKAEEDVSLLNTSIVLNTIVSLTCFFFHVFFVA